MSNPEKGNKITQFVKWMEENRIIRKLAVFWTAWLITVVVLNTTDPLILKDVNAAVATIVTAVIGIFSVVMKALIQGDKEE